MSQLKPSPGSPEGERPLEPQLLPVSWSLDLSSLVSVLNKHNKHSPS